MYSGVAVVFILAVIAGILLFVQLGMNQNAKSGTIRAISTDDKKIKTKLTQDDASFSELFKTNLNVAIESKNEESKKEEVQEETKVIEKIVEEVAVHVLDDIASAVIDDIFNEEKAVEAENRHKNRCGRGRCH